MNDRPDWEIPGYQHQALVRRIRARGQRIRPSPLTAAIAGPRWLPVKNPCQLGRSPREHPTSWATGARPAHSAGRRLEDIDIWWQTRWNIDDDREKAIEEIRMGMATGANHAFRFTFEGKFLPTELEEPIKRLQAAYRSHEMGNLDAPVAPLVDELGSRDYLLERFVIAGTRQDFIKRVEDLAAQGVTQIRLAMSGKDRARLLNIVTREIMPHFN